MSKRNTHSHGEVATACGSESGCIYPNVQHSIMVLNHVLPIRALMSIRLSTTSHDARHYQNGNTCGQVQHFVSVRESLLAGQRVVNLGQTTEL